ncbi:MAG: RNA 2',3'-cyclic phosphodiesterase [Chloroflexi bacterium]|nr:RNA 2',3'-cyclic phosphodiesterase [Chloroflexota bacterium]MBM3172773.1 RNA 2',3'-cyclic phosphodiesterase [Chloroflexota bacterium]MBM3174918.1 RNA 2',3'-cyclic phosphodiesterase [Chloroflexota bacterium]MBM4449697.1 RNA 2',3'-cyclic phosphodiesterase [Chloroflexota bacterium]
MSMEQIRSFIAIELSNEVRSSLRKLQDELKSPGDTFVKWVAPEVIHLTLKFLGNISQQRMERIVRVMGQAVQGMTPFRLVLSEVGAFPNLRQPRVLWVGTSGEVEKLLTMQQRIDNGLVPLGFARESRPFTPHLTLARLREGALPGDKRSFGEMVTRKSPKIDCEVEVNSVNLMRSQLLPSGAVYSRLGEVKLGQS